PADVGHWAATWAKLGSAPPKVLQDLIDYQNEEHPESDYCLNDKVSDQPQWSKDLDDLAHRDFGAFEKALNNHAQETIKRGLCSQVEHVYQDWQAAISQAIGRGLTPEDRQTLDRCFNDFLVEVSSD